MRIVEDRQKIMRERVQQHEGKQRQKTRDRILLAVRELFNEQGEANITFADIGERLGISEGNVWYHFRTRRDLILALFEELQMEARANQQRELNDVRQIEGLLVQGFHLMWEYRFFYRDHINWIVSQREVHEQLVALTIEGHAFIERVLERLCRLELLDIQKSQSATLATNIWIICRYWLDYCQTRNEQRQIVERDFQDGMQQVRALLYPYLTPAGRQLQSRVE